MNMTPFHRHLLFAVLAAAGLVLCAGCYDSHALVEQVRSQAQQKLMHEVDLGFYKTTMPRDLSSHGFITVELKVFGTVPQYQIAAIQKQLKSGSYRLRSETLEAIRGASREELAQPDLAHLRARLTKVANGLLEDAPITAVGFRQFRIVYE